jgi:hypothetical protein
MKMGIATFFEPRPMPMIADRTKKVPSHFLCALLGLALARRWRRSMLEKE